MEDKQYRCQICGRMVKTEHALGHIKAEEYIISLIKKDHPEWNDKGVSCPQCLNYYRELVDKTEI
ncbi:MAG: hypothetical protein JW928_02865 [Candidatus Aureabacteria bacterium]|nr:hypothetical protein [Candidatus Auribacterota bacterium]